ncbi:Peptidase [Candidatus Xenohaliotis californiensis]|uniref:Peptidase n=1 Tax=Candidatus Xenohaliotis californiensis TaxID=84677 RepID=A0ABM9N8Z3_9RICK|nr:Peptidase [Candidatus Xenohaliotis californiensis]
MTYLSNSFQIKSIEENGIFTGYANVFNVIDQQSDIVKPGSFNICNPSEIKLLWQHDHTKPIGKVIEAKEDNKGLYVKCALLLTISRGKEAYNLLKSKIIDGLSIGYISIKDEIREDGVRVLKKIKILEISLVTFPSNIDAKISSVKNTNSINLDHSTLLHSLARAIRILNTN